MLEGKARSWWKVAPASFETRSGGASGLRIGKGDVEGAGVAGVDDDLGDFEAGDVALVVCGQGVVAVVAVLVLDGVFGGVGKDHAPGAAAVVAAPESGAGGVDSIGDWRGRRRRRRCRSAG